MATKNVVSITGTLLLTAIAVFVGRASTRFSDFANDLYYTKDGICTEVVLTGGFPGTDHLTTGGSGEPVSLKVGAATYALFNTSTCTLAHRIRADNL
jgi:hypothetical protein